MSCVRRLCLVICVISLSGCALLRPAAPDLDGYYWMERTHAVFDPERQAWDEEQGRDCLRIKTLSDGKVAFQVNLIQTNGHLCSMTGVAERRGEEIVFRGTRGDFPEGCELRISVLPERLVLHDAEAHCRRYACGVRAALDGMEFIRANREADGPVCVEDAP